MKIVSGFECVVKTTLLTVCGQTTGFGPVDRCTVVERRRGNGCSMRRPMRLPVRGEAIGGRFACGEAPAVFGVRSTASRPHWIHARSNAFTRDSRGLRRGCRLCGFELQHSRHDNAIAGAYTNRPDQADAIRAMPVDLLEVSAQGAGGTIGQHFQATGAGHIPHRNILKSDQASAVDGITRKTRYRIHVHDPHLGTAGPGQGPHPWRYAGY